MGCKGIAESLKALAKAEVMGLPAAPVQRAEFSESDLFGGVEVCPGRLADEYFRAAGIARRLTFADDSIKNRYLPDFAAGKVTLRWC